MFSDLNRRLAAPAAVLGLAVTLSACDNLLGVKNPSVVDDEDITDPAYISHMVNSIINEFQTEQSFLAYAGAKLTDEALNGHNFVQWRDIDLRLIEDSNSQLLNIYEAAQAPRAVADDFVSRLREVLDEAESAFEAYPVDVTGINAAIDAPWRVGDPSDRIIAGTAKVLESPLVTRDEHLREGGYVSTVW
jgi:hypothetical protein